MAARTIISGEPGTVWTNTTDKPKFQLLVAKINSCGVCFQYINQIGSPWPIPFHYGCRCQQRIIRIGAKAPEPFVDYRKIIDDLPPAMRGKVCGASNLKLIDKGVVKWSDVVTGSRIRDLREVVDRMHLSVKTLVDAGVKPAIAEAAVNAVSTSEHDHAERQRAAAMAALTNAGIHQDRLVSVLGKALAQRVSVAEGAGSILKTGEQLPPAWKAQRLIAPGFADELAAVLSRQRPGVPMILTPKPKPVPAPAPVPIPPVVVPEPVAAPEPAVPASGPNGVPVSQALDLANTPAAVKDVTEHTLGVIDKLHGDGKLAKIPVIEETIAGLHGSFSYFTDGRPDRIGVNTISPKADHQSLTAAHEIGHYLEAHGIPNGAGGQRKWDGQHAADTMKDWQAAVEKTSAFRYLASLDGKATTTTGDGKTWKVDQASLDYMMRYDELWARSYAQYVATKSQDPRMLSELDKERAHAHPLAKRKQWKDDDFAPVGKAIDDLFKTLGWVH